MCVCFFGCFIVVVLSGFCDFVLCMFVLVCFLGFVLVLGFKKKIKNNNSFSFLYVGVGWGI